MNAESSAALLHQSVKRTLLHHMHVHLLCWRAVCAAALLETAMLCCAVQWTGLTFSQGTHERRLG